MAMRTATDADVEQVTETIYRAFAGDPIWGPALARADGSTEHCREIWRLNVLGALRYSTVFMTEDASAVAVWIPPGGTELTDEQEAEFDRIVRHNLDPTPAAAVFELVERFAKNHPETQPHAYLSLLATHPDHAGHGIGQQLLAETLAGFDAEGVPSYLESTNPGNNHRYERAGYRAVGGFTAVLDDAPITTMWRPVGAS